MFRRRARHSLDGMPDLHVVAILTAKSGSEGVVGDALSKLVGPTREEEGCLAYDLSVSAVDPTAFVTVERWRSQDDLNAHMKTPHVAEALATAGDHLAAAPAIHPLVPVA